MERFTKQCEFLDGIAKELSNAKSQYEKDKIEVYSVLKRNIETIESYISSNRIKNTDTFNVAMKMATKGMDISLENLNALHNDPDIISLLAKRRIFTRTTFNSIVYVLNFLIASVLNSIFSYSISENMDQFIWLFLGISVSVLILFSVLGLPFNFSNTRITRK